MTGTSVAGPRQWLAEWTRVNDRRGCPDNEAVASGRGQKTSSPASVTALLLWVDPFVLVVENLYQVSFWTAKHDRGNPPTLVSGAGP